MRARRRDTGPGRQAAYGAIALAVILLVGFVSYRALEGLPFQSRYHVTVELPTANRLLATNDVRIEGVRVGQVDRVEAIPGTPPRARVDLSLEDDLEGLPVDSRARVRPASVLGATYVDLKPGTSRESIPEGGTLRQPQAEPPVELVDLFGIFRRSSRRHFRSMVTGLSDSLAGRGPALGTSIAAFRQANPRLERISADLTAPATRTPRFLRSSADFFETLGGVNTEFGDAIGGAARTFAAMNAPSLDATLDVAPSAERATAAAFGSLQPGLDALRRVADGLRPAGRHLTPTLRRVNVALGAGVPPLRRLPALSRRLRMTFAALAAVGRRPSTSGALRKLTSLMHHTDVTFADLAEAQVHCNIIGLGTQGAASYQGILGAGDGPALNAVGISTFGAETDGQQASEPSPDLHVNYAPINNADECETGQEPYDEDEQVFGNPPGLQTGTVASGDIPETLPPPGALDRARAAGLLSSGRKGR